jgi:ribose transport system permease protein
VSTTPTDRGDALADTHVRASARRDWTHTALELLERGGLPIVMAILFAFFALDATSGAVFRSSANLNNILSDQAVTGLVALAMVVPLVAGYFDLSVAAVAGATNVACAAAIGTHHTGVLGGILIALAVGVVIGFANGFLVAKLRLNGFVVTLGTYTLLLGLIQWYTNGQEITEGLPLSFGAWGTGTWLGLPKPFVLLIGVALVTWYVLRQVPYGRYLESIGSNEGAARLVGVNVTRVIWGSFVLSGVLAAMAGVLQTSNAGGADPTVASGLLFPALAAVFLGATTIRPGRYNVWGTIVGVYFVAMSVSGFTLLGANVWVQPVFNGASLVFAVALSTFIARGRERRATASASEGQRVRRTRGFRSRGGAESPTDGSDGSTTTESNSRGEAGDDVPESTVE